MQASCVLKICKVGYTLPQNISRKIGLDYIRAYVSGQIPILSISSIRADPENEIGTGDAPSYYPINSIYSFGFNFRF